MRVAKAIHCVVAVVLYVSAAYAQTAAYDEQYRPQVHFSPQQHWTNDPNGLLYYRGEYHLFFQYNPFGDEWGHMSWGHAVSKDLLHWRELPVALPEENGVMIFTGSVVVDHNNTSGLCAPKGECLVAVYTGYSKTATEARQTQNIAYTLDNGRTWTKYSGNPVLDLHLEDFRDPSVSWDDRERHWLMAVSLPKEHKIRFYSSPDLKAWTPLSDFGPAGDTEGDWECPDLLRIPSSDGKDIIWALKVGLNPGAPQGGSGEQYFLGSFDGNAFTSSTEVGSHGWTNYGKDDYCAISFNGLPRDEKPILLGWMSNWQYAAKLPTAPWRGQMSLPRRLSFIRDSAGLALLQEPVLTPIRGKSLLIPSATLKLSNGGGAPMTVPYEVDLQFGRPTVRVFGVRLYSDHEHWTELGFDTEKKQFYIDRTKSGVEISPNFPARTVAPLIASRPYNLKVVVDRSSVEAYAQDGSIAMTDLVFSLSTKSGIQIFPDEGLGKVSAHAAKLGGIWQQHVSARKP
jgi:fructan beta-fructosidase